MRRLLLVLAVLVGLAVAADRVALAAAKRELATEIQNEEHLDQRPSVQLYGFPFLTQALSGRYDGGEVRLHDVRTPRVRVKSLVVVLHGVQVPLRDLVSGAVRAVPVNDVSGTAQITYADLAAAINIPGLQIRPKGDKVELQVPVQLAGQTVPLIASARVGVNGAALHITSVEMLGVKVQDSIVNVAFAQLKDAVPLDNLPYGLKLSAVRVADIVLEVQLTGHDTVLRPPPA